MKHGLPLSDLDRNSTLELCIDGADEVDERSNLIKGGGGCLLQEKIVASCAKRLYIVADASKDSKRLGEKWRKGVPIEVVPMARVPVQKKLLALGAKSAETRIGSGKAGPLVTDGGHFIIDADFGAIDDPAALDRSIQQIVGVVETGLFIGMTTMLIFGKADGSVYTR